MPTLFMQAARKKIKYFQLQKKTTKTKQFSALYVNSSEVKILKLNINAYSLMMSSGVVFFF